MLQESERSPRVRLGRLKVSQHTFLLVASIIVGCGGGLGAVAFRTLITFATNAATMLQTLTTPILGHAALIVTVGLGGAAAAAIAMRFAPEARGHGVPEVMAAVALKGGIMRPRIIFVKAIASAITIGFGGAAGREGPIVQIGCAIGSVLGQICKSPVAVMRTLVACGAAAGISATFNAPIGGVFFASEVIMGDFAPRSFSVIVVASVVAAVIGRAIFGNHPSFDASAFTLVSPFELGFYALLGGISAIWATVFVRMLYLFEDVAERIPAPAFLKGFLGFSIVGAGGIFLPQILGVGYAAMQHVLDGHVGFVRALTLAVAKPLATSVTLAAGGSGGVFAPSLFTGAMLGDAFGRVVHVAFPLWTAQPSAYGLVAMAAVFAAAAEAPITAIVIVFEMSSDYTIILPLMIATVIATLLGRKLLGSTVYEMKLERRGIQWARVRRPHPLSDVPVMSTLEQHWLTVDTNDSVAAAAGHNGANAHVIIVLENDRVVGSISSAKIARALLEDPTQVVGSLMTRATALLKKHDTFETAAHLLQKSDVAILPIVDDDQRFLGAITRSNVLDAYRAAR